MAFFKILHNEKCLKFCIRHLEEIKQYILRKVYSIPIFKSLSLFYVILSVLEIRIKIKFTEDFLRDYLFVIVNNNKSLKKCIAKSFEEKYFLFKFNLNCSNIVNIGPLSPNSSNKRLKITQFEKVCFIKMNELKLYQVELLSFFSFSGCNC